MNATTLQHQVNDLLASREPQVEVLLVELSGSTARIYIDHPDGVTLELCERVTRALPEIRENLALEVSSPGIERPLTKPDHFRRFVGRRARVRTRQPHDGQRSFTGQLVGVSDSDVTIAAGKGASPVRAINGATAISSPG